MVFYSNFYFYKARNNMNQRRLGPISMRGRTIKRHVI